MRVRISWNLAEVSRQCAYTLVFHSSARHPSGLMIRTFDQYSEGLGFESQLILSRGFISPSLSQKKKKT